VIRALFVEVYKTRRKKVWLIIAALIAAQCLWALWSFSRMDAQDLRQGWLYSFYQFPLLNSIMMPVIAAVVASRLSDMEHKGQTLRLLNTIMPAGRLFDVKFLSGAVYIVIAAALQLFVILLAGYAYGFEGAAPVQLCLYYFLFTIAVSLTILLLQQVISLLFVNQMVALSIGLVGAFTGLFSLYFPPQFGKLILWGYYGVLMFIHMDWDPATRVSTLSTIPVDWFGFVLLVGQFCILYFVGRTLFARKEL
jgi:hypothetical protein